MAGCSKGDDFVFGGSGNDQILAGIGNDYIHGGVGNDELRGHIGEDVLVGGDGNDALFGGGGEDTLIGGEGDDNLAGLDGNDILFGGNGRNILIGGRGADQFVFDVGDLENVRGNIVTDFSVDEGDTLMIAGFEADMQVSSVHSGFETTISIHRDGEDYDVATIYGASIGGANDIVHHGDYIVFG